MTTYKHFPSAPNGDVRTAFGPATSASVILRGIIVVVEWALAVSAGAPQQREDVAGDQGPAKEPTVLTF